MQGVIDQAHWLAFAVVLVSVFRTGRDWRILLTLNLTASLAMALMTVAEYHGYFRIYAPDPTVVRATLGNPIFLGTYLGVNVTIALGFLTRSLIPVAHPGKAPAPAREERGELSNRRDPPRQIRSARLPMLWAGRCFWGAAALTDLWALTLTASRGAFLGFVSGLILLATLYVFLARMRRVRLAAAGSVGLLGIVVVLLLVPLLSPAGSFIDARNANPLLSRLADPESLVSVWQRLLAWKAGIKGFIESPILGWGPENFVAIWGRYGPEFIATLPGVLDHAHNELIEELATKGLFGLLTHAAIWGFAFHIVLRAARDMDSRERIPVLFVGAALMGHFVQSMTTLDLTVGSLQLILLLAFVAHLETGGSDPTPAPGGQARVPASSSFTGTLARRAGSHGVRVSLAAGAIAFAGSACSQTRSSIRVHKPSIVLTSARRIRRVSPAPPGSILNARSTGSSRLRTTPDGFSSSTAAERWRYLRAQNRTEARRLLAMVNAEALAAVESEPENWRIYAALVRFYTAVAITDPEYRDVAKRYRDRALELAPHMKTTAVDVRS